MSFIPPHPFLFAQDTTFSTLITALFLRPIYKVLGEVGAANQESEGYKSMQKTKWMTLLGTILAVLSSTVLYANMVMCNVMGEPGNVWWTNPYLNYGVFGINLDSVLNDVGMILVSGLLKTVSCTALAKHFSTAAPKIDVAPQQQPPVFDSLACERDDE